MRSLPCKGLGALVVVAFLVAGLWGCATMDEPPPAPKAQFLVIPDKTPVTPDLLKAPLTFKGSGFKAKEVVVVDLMLPPGYKMKAVQEGEKSVGLAFANADDQGNFEAKMGGGAVLNWFFQVDWTPNMQPVMDKATPLPPGNYEIRASGMDSDRVGTAVLEILPPPKK
jgi:hypothetical protein